jgi:hypothetical protein
MAFGDGLSYELIDEKPRKFNFGEGYTETWEVVYPNITDWDKKRIKQWLDDHGIDYDKSLSEAELKTKVSEEIYEVDDYSPMMNYIYPLPEDFEAGNYDTDELLRQTTVVNIKDSWGDWVPVLALTGGGMDFSWEIAESYMNLGFYPPAHFCGLPDMAGITFDEKAKYYSERKLKTLNACLKSFDGIKHRGQSGFNDLERLCEQNGGHIKEGVCYAKKK